jgi:hypothetical protein
MKNTNIDSTQSQPNYFNLDTKVNPYGAYPNPQTINPYLMNVGQGQNVNYGFGSNMGNMPNYGMNNPYQQGFIPNNTGQNSTISKPPQEKIKLNYGSLQPKTKEEVSKISFLIFYIKIYKKIFFRMNSSK